MKFSKVCFRLVISVKIIVNPKKADAPFSGTHPLLMDD
jgi:hypothetical protein